VSSRKDGRRHLYIASDSRTRGAMVIDCCPKILTLPRSDCAICFAGDTAATYPLMMQLTNAIAAHQPARDRSLDIRTLKPHLLRVFTDIVRSIDDIPDPIKSSDVQFIFAGYSWLSKSFEIWTIYYSEAKKHFFARPAASFHKFLEQAAFVGDKAKEVRSILVKRLNEKKDSDVEHFEFLPFAVLRDCLREADQSSSIGGPPQLVRIAESMNTRVLAVEWSEKGAKTTTLLGRQLFNYENVDTWTLNPDTFKISRPRSFGYRDE
jgi:hypothetical protein